jgi:hypothetical protein
VATPCASSSLSARLTLHGDTAGVDLDIAEKKMRQHSTHQRRTTPREGLMAVAGTVASARRFLAKELLMGAMSVK